MKPEEDFEWLTLADGFEVHAQGYIQFVLHCGNYKPKVLTRVFRNLHEELILGIPWLVEENPTMIGQVEDSRWKEMEQYIPYHATASV